MGAGDGMTRVAEPHIYTPKHDRGRDCCLHCGRPFEGYTDQPDTAERKRREMQAIPFALPESKRSSSTPNYCACCDLWVGARCPNCENYALPEKRDD
jgi:hypothetical protein